MLLGPQLIGHPPFWREAPPLGLETGGEPVEDYYAELLISRVDAVAPSGAARRHGALSPCAHCGGTGWISGAR